jgi:dTMP kinase
MSGLLISFEGTEGCGKTTQIARLAERLRKYGRSVKQVREPGGTPIGEEIRHTLKHSQQNQAMTAEAELLLMNASRAQLVREVIRPALAAGDIVLCDRFYDSTIAYQGYGRGLDLKLIRGVIDFAVGETRPQLTLLLDISSETSAARLAARQSGQPATRDRFEEADREFFGRVAKGYRAIATEEPGRVKVVDAAASVEAVSEAIWEQVETLV